MTLWRSYRKNNTQKRADLLCLNLKQFVIIIRNEAPKLHFLDEGIAVAIEKHSWPAGSERFWVHAVASQVLKNNHLFSINQLANNRFFGDIKDLEVAKKDTTYHLYDQCGSLVRYLTDEYGMEKFKSFYAKADQDNYRNVFRWIYGKEIEDFEEEWHELLRSY
jgi:hypothetical protein